MVGKGTKMLMIFHRSNFPSLLEFHYICSLITWLSSFSMMCFEVQQNWTKIRNKYRIGCPGGEKSICGFEWKPLLKTVSPK